jgi:hypothetical protein
MHAARERSSLSPPRRTLNLECVQSGAHTGSREGLSTEPTTSFTTIFDVSGSCLVLSSCCRWVEILQSSGENAATRQPEIGAANGFWEMIHGEQWQAIVSHNVKVYYALFKLRSSPDLGAEMLGAPSPNFGQVFTLANTTNPPLCRTPPFGETLINNTSLQVREYLDHYHRPQQAKFFWMLSNGKVAKAHEMK